MEVCAGLSPRSAVVAVLSPDQLPRSPELILGQGLLLLWREPSMAGQASVPHRVCVPSKGKQAVIPTHTLESSRSPCWASLLPLSAGKVVQSSSEQRGASRASLYLRTALPSPPLRAVGPQHSSCFVFLSKSRGGLASSSPQRYFTGVGLVVLCFSEGLRDIS